MIERGDDMEDFLTKDIARLTDLAESTVRKYAQLLEKNGYQFVRNSSGNRLFTEQDIKIFLELKSTPKEEKSIEEIASDIASKYTAKIVTSKEEKADDMKLNQGFEGDMVAILIEKVNDLNDMSQKQMEFNKELVKKLDQQQKYIDERLEQRDKKLMESLRQSQEERKALLEMTATQEEKKKGKSFLARLFGG